MANDILVVMESEIASGNFHKEAYLAGAETGLGVAMLYMMAGGLVSCTFASKFLDTNIEALQKGSDSFPYGKATDGMSLRLALGTAFGSLIPEKYIVRDQLINLNALSKISYLHGLKLALETMFEVWNEYRSKLSRPEAALAHYEKRILEAIHQMPY